jgi:hypothetical protein
MERVFRARRSTGTACAIGISCVSFHKIVPVERGWNFSQFVSKIVPELERPKMMSGTSVLISPPIKFQRRDLVLCFIRCFLAGVRELPAVAIAPSELGLCLFL